MWKRYIHSKKNNWPWIEEMRERKYLLFINHLAMWWLKSDYSPILKTKKKMQKKIYMFSRKTRKKEKRVPAVNVICMWVKFSVWLVTFPTKQSYYNERWRQFFSFFESIFYENLFLCLKQSLKILIAKYVKL